MIKTFTWSQIEELYFTAMHRDFPPQEIKPISLLHRLYKNGNGIGYGYYDNSTEEILRAYAIFEKPKKGNIWLLDYLAVNQNARGKGFGSAFLREMKETLNDAVAIMGEIERIEDAENEIQRQIRTKRKQFYLRNGWIETGVSTIADGKVHYEIICLPISQAVYGKKAVQAMKNIYETLFEPGMYQIFAQMHASSKKSREFLVNYE